MRCTFDVVCCSNASRPPSRPSQSANMSGDGSAAPPLRQYTGDGSGDGCGDSCKARLAVVVIRRGIGPKPFIPPRTSSLNSASKGGEGVGGEGSGDSGELLAAQLPNPKMVRYIARGQDLLDRARKWRFDDWCDRARLLDGPKLAAALTATLSSLAANCAQRKRPTAEGRKRGPSEHK